MAEELVFDREEAKQYEAWFDTAEGQRIDALEKAVLRHLLEDLQRQSGTMLEVACGTGHFSRFFTEQLYWTVTGVDISWPMLEEARTRDAKFPVALADGAALPFPDRSFDVVTIITALEFMPEPVTALREAMRVARRGLLLGALNRWSLHALWRRLAGWFVPSPYASAHFLSAGELRRLIGAAVGQSPVEMEARTAVWPGVLSFLETSRLPLGAFLAARVRW